MKIERRTRHEERVILIGMIVDKKVLSHIAIKWHNRLFRNKWANLIANWCVKYNNKYNQPPLSRIENLYQSWVDKNDNNENARLVEKFLDNISKRI